MKSLYISEIEENSGVVSFSLGLVEFLKSKYKKVAYFKPVLSNNDNDFSLIKNFFKLKISKKDSFVYHIDEVEKLIFNNKESEIISNIIKQYKSLEDRYDFVLIQGIDKEGIFNEIAYELDILIAKNLSIPYINVLNGKNKKEKTILEEFNFNKKHLEENSIEYFSTFINNTVQNFNQKINNQFINSIPYIEEIDSISMYDVYKNLDCKLIYGDKKYLNKNISQVKVISMQIDNFLKYIDTQDLLIFSGDRSDIIATILLSLQSKTSKKVSGIVLTGGIKPSKALISLLKGIDNLPLVILSVKTDTYETVNKVNNIDIQYRYKDDTKISLILGAFNKYIDTKRISEKLINPSHNITTPLMFEYSIVQMAKKVKQNIILPEAQDDRILKAVEILLNREIVDITLLGDADTILHNAELLGVDISKATILNPKQSYLTKELALKLFEIRKNKGMSKEVAFELMEENLTYFATMMVHLGYCSGMVSGASHTTADTVRPALQIIKTKPNIDIVSSVFFMLLDTKVLVYGDCAINQSPNSQELAQIALSSAQTAQAFNINPKVAMLSYSTGNSGSGKDVDKIIEATDILKQNNLDFDVEGPIQYDAAVDKEIAKKKLPNSKVAGDANVLVFPDLNTGNNTYKAVQRSSGAIAIGPILQGLNKPINDLSRGCTVKDIVNTIIITAIQAQI